MKTDQNNLFAHQDVHKMDFKLGAILMQDI